jgi:phage shock protein E
MSRSSATLRFLVVLGAYLVLGFAMFAASGQMSGLMAGGPPVLGLAVLGAAALWSASLTTLLERKGYRRVDPRERVAFGAVAGALSVGGFTLALSWLAWGRIDSVLVPLSALLGGAMQGARAFSVGGFSARRSAGDDDDVDDDVDASDEDGEDMDAKQMISSGALVIDVRTKGEWDQGHLPTAKLLPIDEFEARVGEVVEWAGGDKKKPVVVYCRSGARSGRAKEILAKHGFTQVENGGGYQELK